MHNEDFPAPHVARQRIEPHGWIQVNCGAAPVAGITGTDRPYRPIDRNSNRPRGVLRPWQEADPARWRIPTNMFSEAAGNKWKAYCTAMDTWHDWKDDLRGSRIGPVADIRVCFLNVRALDNAKLDYILWYFEYHRFDVMFLSDVQLTREQVFYEKKRIKERLGDETYVVGTSIAANKMVGGQLAIVRPHLRPYLAKEEADPFNLGLYLALTFKHADRTLTVAGVYWPNNSQGEGALWSNTLRAMRLSNQVGTVRQYVRRLIANVIEKTMEDPRNTCLVGGDWNANWKDSASSPRRSHTGISQWAQELGLVNALAEVMPVVPTSRYAGAKETPGLGTCIDHIITTQTTANVISAGTDHSPLWQTVSDHRPIWCAIHLDTPLKTPAHHPSTPVRPIRRVELDRKDQAACEEMRTKLRAFHELHYDASLGIEDLSDWMELMCLSTVNIVRSHMRPPPKVNRRFSDGWSPTYRTMAAQLSSLVEIRRHLTGQGRRRRWFGVAEEDAGVRKFIKR